MSRVSVFRGIKTLEKLKKIERKTSKRGEYIVSPSNQLDSLTVNIKLQRKELINTKNALKKEWMRKQLNIEIKTVEGSRYVDNVNKRKIKEYSLSSQKRRKFLMYCIRAQIENDYLLVTDLIKLIGISRAGAETMIKECEEANWIRIERCSKNRRKIQATDMTVETYADYCDWLWEIIDKSEMRNLSVSINEIEKLERSF